MAFPFGGSMSDDTPDPFGGVPPMRLKTRGPLDPPDQMDNAVPTADSPVVHDPDHLPSDDSMSLEIQLDDQEEDLPGTSVEMISELIVGDRTQDIIVSGEVAAQAAVTISRERRQMKTPKVTKEPRRNGMGLAIVDDSVPDPIADSLRSLEQQEAFLNHSLKQIVYLPGSPYSQGQVGAILNELLTALPQVKPMDLRLVRQVLEEEVVQEPHLLRFAVETMVTSYERAELIRLAQEANAAHGDVDLDDEDELFRSQLARFESGEFPLDEGEMSAEVNLGFIPEISPFPSEDDLATFTAGMEALADEFEPADQGEPLLGGTFETPTVNEASGSMPYVDPEMVQRPLERVSEPEKGLMETLEDEPATRGDLIMLGLAVMAVVLLVGAFLMREDVNIRKVSAERNDAQDVTLEKHEGAIEDLREVDTYLRSRIYEEEAENIVLIGENSRLEAETARTNMELDEIRNDLGSMRSSVRGQTSSLSSDLRAVMQSQRALEARLDDLQSKTQLKDDPTEPQDPPQDPE